MTIAFSWQIFEKESDKFNEKASRGSRVVPNGRTDGQTKYDEGNSGFKQFYESTKKKNMNSVLKIFFVRENEKLLNTWKDETT